jgi:hypothetical protein
VYESKESIASQASVRPKQYGRRQSDEISDPWRRERNVVVAVDGSDHSDGALDCRCACVRGCVSVGGVDPV